jgi:hypothetical protein
MTIKYDGMTFGNPSELKAYKKLVSTVCGENNIDQKMEDEIMEIEALENDNFDNDNNLDFQFNTQRSDFVDNDDTYGELQF